MAAEDFVLTQQPDTGRACAGIRRKKIASGRNIFSALRIEIYNPSGGMPSEKQKEDAIMANRKSLATGFGHFIQALHGEAVESVILCTSTAAF